METIEECLKRLAEISAADRPDAASLLEVAKNLARLSRDADGNASGDAVDLLDGIAELLVEQRDSRSLEGHLLALGLAASDPSIDARKLADRFLRIAGHLEQVGDLDGALAVHRQLVALVRTTEGIDSVSLRARLEDLKRLLTIARYQAREAKQAARAAGLEVEIHLISSELQALERQFGKDRVAKPEAATPNDARQREQMDLTHALQPVLYCTTRSVTGDKDPYRLFGGERSDDKVAKPAYGRADVWVPRHRRAGDFATPSRAWMANKYRGDYRPDAASRAGLFLLDDVKPMSVEDWDTLTRTLAAERKSSKDRPVELLLYVHGYNTRFWEAIMRAAQLGADLDVRGVVAAFSWPSAGYSSPIHYRRDERQAIAAQQIELEATINRLQAAATVGDQMPRTILIAHSLGCRLLANALERFSLANPGRKLVNDVVFAAPDIDVADFVPRMKSISSLAERVSVYCSPNDRALAFGKTFITLYQRAGQNAADLAEALSNADRASRVAAIDTSAIKADLIGHNDVTTSGIDDLCMMSWLNFTAPQREQLLLPSENAPRHWQYRLLGDRHPKAGGHERPTRAEAIRGALSRARHTGSIESAVEWLDKYEHAFDHYDAVRHELLEMRRFRDLVPASRWGG